jgi:hemoglobin
VTDGHSFYEALGGRDTFVRLVDRFYDGVAADSVLRGMYPGRSPATRYRQLVLTFEGPPVTAAVPAGECRRGVGEVQRKGLRRRGFHPVGR